MASKREVFDLIANYIRQATPKFKYFPKVVRHYWKQPELNNTELALSREFLVIIKMLQCLALDKDLDLTEQEVAIVAENDIYQKFISYRDSLKTAVSGQPIDQDQPSDQKEPTSVADDVAKLANETLLFFTGPDVEESASSFRTYVLHLIDMLNDQQLAVFMRSHLEGSCAKHLKLNENTAISTRVINSLASIQEAEIFIKKCSINRELLRRLLKTPEDYVFLASIARSHVNTIIESNRHDALQLLFQLTRDQFFKLAGHSVDVGLFVQSPNTARHVANFITSDKDLLVLFYCGRTDMLLKIVCMPDIAMHLAKLITTPEMFFHFNEYIEHSRYYPLVDDRIRLLTNILNVPSCAELIFTNLFSNNLALLLNQLETHGNLIVAMTKHPQVRALILQKVESIQELNQLMGVTVTGRGCGDRYQDLAIESPFAGDLLNHDTASRLANSIKTARELIGFRAKSTHSPIHPAGVMADIIFARPLPLPADFFTARVVNKTVWIPEGNTNNDPSFHGVTIERGTQACVDVVESDRDNMVIAFPEHAATIVEDTLSPVLESIHASASEGEPSAAAKDAKETTAGPKCFTKTSIAAVVAFIFFKPPQVTLTSNKASITLVDEKGETASAANTAATPSTASVAAPK